MGDRVDTPTSTSSEGSPPLGSRVSASSFSRHSDEASQGADAEVSYPASIADKNPFAVALPNKPRRLYTLPKNLRRPFWSSLPSKAVPDGYA